MTPPQAQEAARGIDYEAARLSAEDTVELLTRASAHRRLYRREESDLNSACALLALLATREADQPTSEQWRRQVERFACWAGEQNDSDAFATQARFWAQNCLDGSEFDEP